MPCVSGGALAGGTSACGLRPAAQPAPTGLPKTISFVSLGDGKGARVEEGQAVRWSGQQMSSEHAGQEQDTGPISQGDSLRHPSLSQPAPGELRGPRHPHSSQAEKLRPE